MSEAIIYKPSKNAMQSGTYNTKQWRLEFRHDGSRFTDPMMGWTGSQDMNQEIRMAFDSLEEAKAYAETHCMSYVVDDSEEVRTLKKKSYAANFTTPRVPASKPNWN